MSSSVSTMSPNGVLCAASISPAACPTRLAADRARVLERNRVALLRHDAAALHEAVRQAQVAELHRAPEQQVLDDAAEADEQNGGRADALEQVIDRRDAAVGVAGHAVEAEQRGGTPAVDGKPRAGDRAGAERILVGAGERRLQPHGVAFELLDDGEQVVRDGGRLRRLRVRVRGEHGLAIPIRQRQQRPAQRQRALDDRQDHLPLRHAVHRHVDVVARARGMEPPGRVVAAPADDQRARGRRTGPRRCRRTAPCGFRPRSMPSSARADGGRLGGRDDLLIAQHDEMGVIDRHHRHEELRLGVFEVFVEDDADVVGRKFHATVSPG